MMEHPTDEASCGRAPFQLTPARAPVHSCSKPDFVPQQVAKKPAERAQFVELVKEQLDGGSHLFIRVQSNLAGWQLDVPARHVKDQLASLGLVKPSPFQTVVHQDRLIFTYIPFQPQEETIVR